MSSKTLRDRDLTREPSHGAGTERPGARLPDHLLRLPGGSWVQWRRAILRGAGFPAAKVEELAAPRAAAAADRLLELEERTEELRTRALDTVDEALDQLRASGRWSETELRKPLLKTPYALSKGKLSARPPATAPAVVKICGLYGEARDRVGDAVTKAAASYEADTLATSRSLEVIAGWGRFREAVAWQNRHTVLTALDPLVGRRGPVVRNSQRRQREEAVANYLQRYCLKNDTIGFFGPVGWARFESEGEDLVVRHNNGFLSHRQVYFENWCVDALARKLGQPAAVRRWLAPRLHPAYRVDGDVLHSPFRRPARLTPLEARVIAACDGERPAQEIVTRRGAESGAPMESPEEVYAALESLRRRRILLWGLAVPLEPHPERYLAERLERIGELEARSVALSALDELDRARHRLARAAGDAEAVSGSMAGLEAVFQRLTGLAPQRHSAQTYAARGLVYEDCRRATEVTLGPEIPRRLGAPLTLVLRSAAWLAGELARRTEAKLETLWEELRPRHGLPIGSYRLVSRILPELFLRRDRATELVEVEKEFQRRWGYVLELEQHQDERRIDYRCEQLAERVEEAFGEPRPAWQLTRYFSPDVMIAADGEEAVARGDFDLVLGEIHSSNTLTWSCFVSQHPMPEELLEDFDRDIEVLGGDCLVFPQVPKQTWTQRMAVGVLAPRVYRYEFTEAPRGRLGRPLPAGEVVVEKDAEGLMARTCDGKLRFRALELLGPYLSQECNSVLGAWILNDGHAPRVRIDDVVVSRERWLFRAGELDMASVQAPFERFVATRRWARRHGMPRQCFFKVTTERKPCYLDFSSPIYVDLFPKMVRSAVTAGTDETVSIVEMLPRPDQLWLADANGQRYTCELRTAVYERQ